MDVIKFCVKGKPRPINQKKKKFIHVCTLRKGEGKKKGLLVDNSKYLSWVFVGIFETIPLEEKR